MNFKKTFTTIILYVINNHLLMAHRIALKHPIGESQTLKNKQSSSCRLQTFGPPLLLQRLADVVGRLQMLTPPYYFNA
ncbi:hypothetical protein LXL04_038782 [Taraxacum kok-saghyz]